MSYRPIRKMQRKARKVMQRMNKNIENDNLWQGRFVVRQIGKKFTKYEDGSGYDVVYTIAVADKKTGKYKIARLNQYDLECGWSLFNLVNNFIVDDVGVWGETPSPTDVGFCRNWIKVPLILKNHIQKNAVKI